jgi:hypothetical protein
MVGSAEVIEGRSAQAYVRVIERFISDLLDQAQRDALRGALTAATVRRLVARDLSEIVASWQGSEA